MRVQLRVSRELVEQLLVLGDRRIVGVSLEETGREAEPSALVVFEVEASDAPEGAIEMSPIFRREAGRVVIMVDPGWIFR